MRYFISINYNGSSFVGWQRQLNGLAIQESLERALSLLLREQVAVVGAGRTDSGVHALNYIAHFDSDSPYIKENLTQFIYKINAIIESGIVVNSIFEVNSAAHARFDATARRYHYHINTKKNPFIELFSYYYPRELDIQKMNEAAKLLLGRRDFTSMAKLHSNSTSNICEVFSAKWSISNSNWLLDSDNFTSQIGIRSGVEEYYLFEIEANRFLRDMVRAIVGTLLQVGVGKYPKEWVEEVLERKDRGAAGESVPARGLFFMGAKYPYPLQ